jgi:beta-carotene 3-hydroxylase
VGKAGGVSFGFILARDPTRLKRQLAAQKKTGLARPREAAE